MMSFDSVGFVFVGVVFLGARPRSFDSFCRTLCKAATMGSYRFLQHSFFCRALTAEIPTEKKQSKKVKNA